IVGITTPSYVCRGSAWRRLHSPYISRAPVENDYAFHRMSDDFERGRSRLTSRLESGGVWLVGHLSRVWPFALLAVVLALSWHALRDINPRAFRAALRSLDPNWLAAAAAITLANTGAMGLYDVIAFRHTRSTWRERWRYGAVSFAWSNFLTLGPL